MNKEIEVESKGKEEEMEKEVIRWSRIEKQFVPEWFIPLLSDMKCAVSISDSRSGSPAVMWRFENNHMDITFDKLLMYANNVLQYRTYYYEGEV